MRSGGVPESKSRATRVVSAWVLPEHALADTQTEVPGSEARRWASSGARLFVCTGLLIRPLPQQRPIPSPGKGDRNRHIATEVSRAGARDKASSRLHIASAA